MVAKQTLEKEVSILRERGLYFAAIQLIALIYEGLHQVIASTTQTSQAQINSVCIRNFY